MDIFSRDLYKSWVSCLCGCLWCSNNDTVLQTSPPAPTTPHYIHNSVHYTDSITKPTTPMTSPIPTPTPHDLSTVEIHSIASYLNSHPELKESTAIITDHQYPELFFAIPGVKRAKFTDSTLISAASVKLFEFADTRALIKTLGNAHNDKSVVSMFDSSSYVYMMPTSWTTDTSQELFQIFDELTDAKLHIGLPTYHTSDASVVSALYRDWEFNFGHKDEELTALEPEDCPAWSADGLLNLEAHAKRVSSGLVLHGTSALQETDFSCLYSLRLEDFTSFTDLVFPQLRELTIVTKPFEDGSAPVIKGIVAPELRRLSIHYKDGILPHISYMSNVATQVSKDYAMEEDDITTVELLSLSDADPPTFGPPNACPLKDRDIIVCRDFFKNFSTVHLYGTPPSLLYLCDLTSVSRLRLQICHMDRFGCANVVTMPALESITIDAATSHAFLPRITSKDTSEVFLNILAPSVTVNNIWHIRCPAFVDALYVYYSPKLVAQGHIPEISMEHGLFDYLMAQKKSITSLSLVGVFLPFITKDSKEVMEFPLSYLDLALMDKVVLRPLLSRSVLYKDSEFGGKIYYHTGVLLVDNVGFRSKQASYGRSFKCEVMPLVLPLAQHDSVDDGHFNDVLVAPNITTLDGHGSDHVEQWRASSTLAIGSNFSSVITKGYAFKLEELGPFSKGSLFEVVIATDNAVNLS